jgi:hypothetical protein
MKGKKEMHEAEADRPGVDDAKEDLKTKPERYGEGRPEDEAEERKYGGKAESKAKGHKEDKKEDEKKKREHKRRKHGGKTVEMHGEEKRHGGRMPRKSGGRATSDMNPFTSARMGTPAKGRKLEKVTMGDEP